MSKTHNYRRLRAVKIESVTHQDKNGWVGLITNNGELRCKKELQVKLKLKKGFSGSITVGDYKDSVVVAFDQKAHIETENHWNILYPEYFSEEDYGYLYRITNKITGKLYIGMKFFHAGNWKAYTSSCKPLNEDIEALGKENFKFEILFSCESRGGTVYAEANMQHKLDVLTATAEDGSRLWYNNNIAAIKFIPNENNLLNKINRGING